MTASGRKELRDFAAVLRKKGYKIAPGGKSGHYKLLDKKGRQVVDDDGPIIFSGSPSEFRNRDQASTRLIRAKIITANDLPWKPQQAKERDDGPMLGEPEKPDPKIREEQKKRAEQRSRHERTQLIRGDLEQITASLGGWTKRGMMAETADLVFFYNQDAPHAFKSKSAALANVQTLRKGGTLSETQATAWEAFLQDLKEAPDTRSRWFELLRQARGILPADDPRIFSRRVQSIVDPDSDDQKVILVPEPTLGRKLAERYDDREHPVLEFHRNGGVRWDVDFTIDELNAMSRMVGFFEGLAVQLAVFPGGDLVGPHVEALSRMVEKVGEARARELARRSE